MVKWKQYDIYLLLGSLFVFSCGIGLLHIGKKDKQEPTIKTLLDVENISSQSNNFLDESSQFIQNLSSQELIQYLRPFLASRSIEKIVDELKGIPADRMVPIARLLTTQNNIPLLPLDKKELLQEIAALYTDEQQQALILDLFLENKELLKGKSLFVIAAEVPVKNTLPVLINWYNKVKSRKDVPEDLRTLITNAYQHAIDENKVELFSRLQKYIPLQEDQATQLLWRTVEENKSPEFIALLKAAQANLDSIKDKKTPLIEAVLNQNYKLVDALLTAETKVNFVPDDVTGSALQNLLRRTTTFEREKSYNKIRANIQIEELLRNYGARE